MAPPTPPRSSGWRRLSVALLVLILGATPVSATGEQSVTAQLRVSPLMVALELSASTIKIGQTVTARVVATNLGAEIVRSVTLSLRFEPVGLIGKGATTARLNLLKGGRSAEASFRLCGAAVGSYLVLAQAELESVTIESPARLLSVVEGRKQSC